MNFTFDKQKIKFFAELPSTSTLLKTIADENAPHGTVLIADKQTEGHGRFNRPFFSPNGGLYMSMLMRPPFIPENFVKITAAVAVNVCRVINQVCGVETNIKWVNDIELNRKKIGGILTEAKFDIGNKIKWLVVGIGLNLITKNFPEDLRCKLTSLFDKNEVNLIEIRNKLAFGIIEKMQILSYWFNEDILAEYKKRNTLVGEMVYVMRGDQKYIAEAIGIDDNLRLLVRKVDGTVIALLSEEVSVKLNAKTPPKDLIF